MSLSLRISYVTHTVRSDWNNGNAHFLRGFIRALGAMHHSVTVIEPEKNWSIDNLRTELLGAESLSGFARAYQDLNIVTYGDLEE